MKITTDEMSEDILSSNETRFLRWQEAVRTIISGGVAVGMLDGLFAIAYYGLILDVPTVRIFQSVAAGLLGKDSFDGGTQTFLLGVVLHFVVASCIASVYYLASLKLPILIRQAVFCGLIYGMIAYLGMNYVVIPLSNAVPGKFSFQNFIVAFVAHAFLVGLPIALITRNFAKSRDKQTWMEKA